MAVLHNPFLWIAVAGYVLSSMAGVLPAPQPKDGKAYMLLYRTVHLLAANWDKVTAAVEQCAEEKTT